MVIDKLPHDQRFEQSAIGCILMDNDAAIEIISNLTVDDFYSKKNRIIFEAAAKLAGDNSRIDILTITQQLETDRHEVTMDYLSACVDMTPSTANALMYCQVLREMAIQRRGIENAVRAKQILERGDMTHDEKIKLVRANFSDIFDASSKGDFAHIKNDIHSIIDEWDKKNGQLNVIDGVPTGYEELDKATLGWQPCDTIIIAANTSVGKSTLALNFAVNAARKGYPVGVFSLEMSGKQNVIRIMSYYAGINGHSGRYGKMRESDWTRLVNSVGAMEKLPIYIDDSSSLTTLDIYGRARRLQSEYGARMFVVDYIQKVRGVRKYQSQYEELTDVSDRLKAIAKELAVPIIVVSQFNRAGAQNEGLSKLKGSSGIEQDADIVMILKPHDVENSIYRLEMEKHRNGPTTWINLHFDKATLTFRGVNEDQDQSQFTQSSSFYQD